MQIQDSTTNTVTVDSEDLYAVLYRVPHELRDDAFTRIANQLDYAIHGDDPLCVCGTYRSEHVYCGCESFEAVQK